MVAWRYIVAGMQERSESSALRERAPVLLYPIDASPNVIYNPLNEPFQNPKRRELKPSRAEARVGVKPYELAKPALLNTRTTVATPWHCTEHE